MLLSTRLAIFEDMFGGLDRVIVHRTAGVIVMISFLKAMTISQNAMNSRPFT